MIRGKIINGIAGVTGLYFAIKEIAFYTRIVPVF